MDMKKLIQSMTDIENGKKPLNESAIAECGDIGSMPAPVNQGNPVTASITLNASGMDNVADLMRLIQQAGIEKAGPPAPEVMPMRQDIERLRDIVGRPEMEADAAYSDIINDESFVNEPDEQYADHQFMTHDLAGGINRPKKMFKPAAKGDNPMAVESDEDKVKESIKTRLERTLAEKKAKPDFLDMDKDGNKKEPMKKAIADKKKKKVGEAKAKPDFLDMDKDGNKKEPMKKAIADKKKKAPVKEGVALSPTFIKHLQMTFGDKAQLSRGEMLKVKDLINKLSIEDIKTLMSANIPHVSQMAKLYLRNKTPGGMIKYKEAEVQAPTHELDDTARKAMNIAQMIKRKINSGEQMDDRDYNQMAELGAVLSRFGTNFGPKSMKDVMAHMVQYTNDRNEEGHGYPKFNVDRFKELIAMARSTGESMVGEISDKTRSSYVKKAFNSYDAAQASGDKKTMKKRGQGLDSAYDSKIRSDKKRRETNSKKGDYDYNFGYGESVTNEISSDLAKRYTKAAKMDRDFNDDDIKRLSKSGQSTQDMHRRNAKRTKGINRAAKRM